MGRNGQRVRYVRDALYAQLEWAERQILLYGIENPEASSSDKRLGWLVGCVYDDERIAQAIATIAL
jgi:hypothetical protein